MTAQDGSRQRREAVKRAGSLKGQCLDPGCGRNSLYFDAKFCELGFAIGFEQVLVRPPPAPAVSPSLFCCELLR